MSSLSFTTRESAVKWFQETFVVDSDYVLAANEMRDQYTKARCGENTSTSSSFVDKESAVKWFEETFVTDTEYILAANVMRTQLKIRKQIEILQSVVDDLS